MNAKGSVFKYPDNVDTDVIIPARHLTTQAAKELASRNITVNAGAPGFIETDMTAVLPEKAKTAMLATIPMAAPGQPEDVARAAAFFARPESAYITGQVLCVDGGMAV